MCENIVGRVLVIGDSVLVQFFNFEIRFNASIASRLLASDFVQCFGRTALMFAASEGRTDCVRELVGAGADTEATGLVLSVLYTRSATIWFNVESAYCRLYLHRNSF
jgi:hypothetical protein